MKTPIRYLLLLATLWHLAGALQLATAQQGKFYSADTKLSSSLINQLYQDSRGFVWIATEYGLNRFDGLHFVTYWHVAGDTTSLKDNYVHTIFEDSRRRLLVGCATGLQRYDPAADCFTDIPIYRNGKRVHPHITQILERTDGHLWFATSGQGVFRLDSHLTCATPLEPLMQKVDYLYFNSIYEDTYGDVWLGTEHYGLLRYRPSNGRVQRYRPPDVADNWITALCEDAAGRLYVGTSRHGVMRYERAANTFVAVPSGQQGTFSVYCMKLVNGRLLIGTDGQGLKWYNPRSRCVEDVLINSTPIDFADGKVHSILQDQEKNLWLGLFQKGALLIAAEQKEFQYYGYKSAYYNPIGRGCVMALHADTDRRLWVGTDNEGLYVLDDEGRRLRHYAPGRLGIPAVVTCIFRDSRRNLWLGSYKDGIVKLDEQTGQCYTPFPQIENKNVYAIAEDKHENLYIGTLGSGFYIYNLRTEQLIHYESRKDESGDLTRNELVNDWLNGIFCDRDGLIWLAHYKGVSCFDPASANFLTYGGRNLLISGCTGYAFAEDARGRIWMGTTDGLYCFDKHSESIRKFTMADGLPNNVICGICEDSQHNMWISTYRGISKYDAARDVFVNYYVGDGLQGNEFTHGAFYKDYRGKCYFGGVNGITAFQPEAIGGVEKKMQVWITGFLVSGRPANKNTLSGGDPIMTDAVQDAREFRLSYADNTFSLNFSTLRFHNPEQIVYQYRIRELDEEWKSLEPGTTQVTYNKLPAGNYTFNVRALNHGLYSDVREVSIRIAPAWYRTWWAYGLYALLGGLFLLGVANYILARMRHRREMMKREHIEQLNEAKLQFFINISHEIRTPMTLIINPLEKLLAESKPGPLHHTYLMIYRNAQRILRLINQLMDVRKLDKGQITLRFRETDMVGFIDTLVQAFDYTARKKNIRFTFQHDMEELKAWIDLNNFDKVLMNILSNAFKYTPEGGEVQIVLTTGSDETRKDALNSYFQIAITDSGIGIDSDKIDRIFDRFYQIDNEVTLSNFGTGIGLHLARSLVLLHHGVIFAENRADGCSGTRFVVRLPLGAAHLRPDELETTASSHAVQASLESAMRKSIDILTEEDDGDGGKAAEAPTARKMRPKVLVVEDEDEIRQYLQQELSGEYKVETCRDGKEAYEKVLRQMPDLVVSDIVMPGMDGLTLCRKIKQHTNVNHVPVILLSAKARPEDTLKGMGIGADAYLTKPFNIDLLKSTVANLIANRRLLRNKFSGSQQQEQRMEKLEVKSGDEQLMERIMKVVNKHLDNPEFSVEVLAQEVGLSRVHVHRKLKELTNLSARDFIKNIRLQQAAKLLSDDKKLTVSEAAYATGFTNLSHFSSSFREKFGMSPSEYMELHG